MFGYIKLYKPEMKLKDIKNYQAMYCSLCNQLKKDYGFFSRFILSYDIAFLLIALNDIISSKPSLISFRCPYNFFKMTESKISSNALEYSAFINYWLAIEKIDDDIKDNRSFFQKVLKRILSNKKYKCKFDKFSSHIIFLHNQLSEIYKCEDNANSLIDFDTLTNKFGGFFSNIFDTSTVIQAETHYSVELKQIFFQIGKWIYIMDAFDDYYKDERKCRFNIINLLFLENDDKPSKQDVVNLVLSIHLQIISKINTIYSKLHQTLEPCIENIINYGMTYVFYTIKNKKYKECEVNKNATGNFMEFMGM